MSSTKVEISKIIYSRLKSAYGFSSDKELGERFGISKQAVNKRKQRGTIDRDEIVRLFPDVNRDWLYSKEIDQLNTMPVRERNETGVTPSAEKGASLRQAREKVASVEKSVNDYIKSGIREDDPEKLLEHAEMLIRIARELMKK